MPHIIIEFSRDLASDTQIGTTLDAVHQAAAATRLFDARHIRVRAYPVYLYRVGGNVVPFLHAQIRIHSGRTAEQKRQLSSAVLDALREHHRSAYSITVEVVEMERESYTRFIGEDVTRLA